MEYIPGETLEVAWPKSSPDTKLDVANKLHKYFDNLREGLVRVYLDKSGSEEKTKYYSRIFPEVLKDHRAVFTHADLQKKNIILKQDYGLAVVDWEAAGWHPKYWEYAVATIAHEWNDDCHDCLVKALDEYPGEYAWLNLLIRELWSQGIAK